MTDPAPAAAPPSQLRSRLILLLIVAMFFASFGIAAVLRFTGWEPASTRNIGELLHPPLDLTAAELIEEADAKLELANPEREWTALVRLPAQCDDACWQKLAMLPRVRAALGQHAPELRLRVLDAAIPAERRAGVAPLTTVAVRAGLPAVMAPSAATTGPDVWLVDPHGYAVLYYAPGFDPSGLRKDLARLLK
jgi:hypothetical protein